MTDEKRGHRPFYAATISEKTNTRRRALKTLLTGGALGSAAVLPDRWIKPAVNSVLLPAHAVSSCTATGTSSKSYSGAGTYTFTVPAGVTSITALAKGAGGGGGGSSTTDGAGGGAGGTGTDCTSSITGGGASYGNDGSVQLSWT